MFNLANYILTHIHLSSVDIFKIYLISGYISSCSFVLLA